MDPRAEASTIELSIDNGVAEFRFTQPDQRNCVSMEFAEDLCILTDYVFEQENINVIMFTAEGPVFCAGADVDIAKHGSPKQDQKLRELFHPTAEKLKNSPTPIIAGARGAAIGVGAELLCGVSDLRVVGQDIEIWYPETEFGIPMYETIARYTREIGSARALELILLGESGKLTADEAKRIGLINRIVEPNRIEEVTRNISQTISSYESEHGIVSELIEMVQHTNREMSSASIQYGQQQRREMVLTSVRQANMD
ncbi:enoyl-CoA hydratase/isomerase family protein [Halobellus rarus]|uniref:Enoyl-CoA hydratase/isomerase family protein n=1 Tax=Halobellus rarus TaxID=1126237 RepID=A0ABD6CUC8_9EURY